MDTMATIRETFFQECGEQLDELESGLLAMEEGDAGADTVNAVFRAVHSIKGGAGAFKLERLVRFAHAFETTLDLIRSDRLAPSGPVLKTMLRSSDALADLVRAARTDGEVDEGRIQVLIEELQGLCNDGSVPDSQRPSAALDLSDGETDPFGFQPLTISFDDFDDHDSPEPSSTKTFAIFFKPTEELYSRGNETARLLRELGRLGDVTTRCDATGLPPLDEIDPQGAYFAWNIELVTTQDIASVEEVFEFVVDDCELRISSVSKSTDDVREAAPSHDSEPAHIDKTSPLRVPEIVAAHVSNAARAQGKDGEPATASSPEAANRKPEGAKVETAAQTIRVDLERVDRLANLIGELVINQAMLSQRVAEAGLSRSSSVTAGLGALEQLTREIQEGIMAIRAQPVKPLFQRMTRIVRELADATGKKVRLRTEGEGTEVDRTVFEKLADPLTHMIRNAIDHGLESPEDRMAAGKPDHGEVRLSAGHRSGRILIDVSDDGKGIDRARVKAKAIEKQLIAPDAQLSNAEIDNLLFLPGFSTAAEISDISGRGVGMDVVKSSIQALGGRISISSRPGLGTTFSLSLPLTLAVLDGMVVKVADQTLVVPLTTIVETRRPKQSDVHSLGFDARVMADREGFVPLIDVGRELGYRACAVDPLEKVVLVVETEVSTRCALIVDAILDQRQVVIKSLATNYRQVPGVAAATILGDGRVALILDIDTFVEGATDRGALSPQPVLAAAS